MINSLLELIGALFLAGLPIFLMLARIRRRRRLQREATAAEGPRRNGAGVGGREEPRRPWSLGRLLPRREGWFRSLARRRPDADLAPVAEPPGGGRYAQPGGTSRRGGASGGAPGSGTSRGTGGGLEWQDTSGYRPLSSPASSEALLRRVERYPPLQRAIVLKELLGPTKGLDDHLPGGNT
ncbi:MAG: hypothetical protein R6U25_09890 [Alkalispirochaeta sp.]